MEAAKLFDVAPGINLADRLWCRSGAYWHGEVTAALTGGGQGFLLLFGNDVDDWAVFSAHASPFLVADRIDRPAGAGGPYITLIACRMNPLGKAEAVRGYAQPILSGQRFVPVGSILERDVIKALVVLQERLDALGIDCTIESVLPDARRGADTDLRIAMSDDAGRSEDLALRVIDRADPGGPRGSTFVVTPTEWADGSFVRWLEQQLAVRR